MCGGSTIDYYHTGKVCTFSAQTCESWPAKRNMCTPPGGAMVAKMCKVETVMTNTSLLAPDVAEAAAGAGHDRPLPPLSYDRSAFLVRSNMKPQAAHF